MKSKLMAATINHSDMPCPSGFQLRFFNQDSVLACGTSDGTPNAFL
jgi:hypothetical protein